jgi:flagellar assembly protein FliH
MSSVLPKEQQTAYQRWEMASFENDRRSAKGDRRSAPPSEAAVAELAQQVAEAREAARLEGYAAGLEQGRMEGLDEGRAQAAEELRRLQGIAETFGTEVLRASETVAHDMLDLALDLAKAMLKTALVVNPGRVIPIVGEAIGYLPSLQQPMLLILHPGDAQLVRNGLHDDIIKAGWRIVEDAQMERGGCRVETAANQIDATAPVRWQRIAAALGKDADWLA